MSLYKQWEELMNGQTEDTIQEFWDEYSSTEQKIYDYILNNHTEPLKGTVESLVDKFQCNPVIFEGFLDGINSSLVESIDVEKIELTSEINLVIDFEKLFFNMLNAEADYLFNLESWDGVLPIEDRQRIYKDFKRSKIVVKPQTPGRNDPCSCGSGKKYKKCCGK